MRELRIGFAVLIAFAPSVLACSKDSASANARSATADLSTSSPPAPRGGGSNYKVDAHLAGDCATGATCTVAIDLEALGAYHINKEYPYKFKANDAPGVEYLGSDPAGKNVFSSSAGDLAVSGEKTATMSVKFKPAAKGPATVSGVYKLSVCSVQNCQVDQADITTPVTVK